MRVKSLAERRIKSLPARHLFRFRLRIAVLFTIDCLPFKRCHSVILVLPYSLCSAYALGIASKL